MAALSYSEAASSSDWELGDQGSVGVYIAGTEAFDQAGPGLARYHADVIRRLYNTIHRHHNVRTASCLRSGDKFQVRFCTLPL